MKHLNTNFYIPLSPELVFLRKNEQASGLIPGNNSCLYLIYLGVKQTLKQVQLYVSFLALGGSIFFNVGVIAINTGPAFAAAIGTMMRRMRGFPTVTMRPIRIPIETAITGFGGCGWFRSRAVLGEFFFMSIFSFYFL